MVLGIDYTDEYTQISYAGPGMKNPESVSISIGEKKYLIPTIVCKDQATGQWLIGDKAMEMISNGEDCFFKKFLSKAIWDESEIIEDQEYAYTDILSVFLKNILEIAKTVGKMSDIERIVLTLETVNKETVDLIHEIMGKLDYDSEKVDVVSHSESFSYYVTKQSKELWTFDVVLFDFSPTHFIYRRIKIQNNKKPIIVSVLEEDFTELINLQNTDDEVFLEIIQKRFEVGTISSVYLNGVGFTGDWMNRSLEYICDGRRAFRGQNIFSKGACYGALYKSLGDENEYLFLCSGRNRVNVSLIIQEKGENRQLVLARAGIRWYDAGAKVECVLDDVRNIMFTLNSPLDKINKTINIELNTFPFRAPKTTRIEIFVTFNDEETLSIIIKDLGFGDLFKSSGKTIERIVSIKEYLQWVD